MSEKSNISKGKLAPEKPSVSVKPVPAKVAVTLKPEKKNPEKKIKKANGKVELKVKVIRDSFTMPQNDYAKIAELKQVCQKAGLQVKKSELLRAGLHALSNLSAVKLKQTIVKMEQIKTGRPKKS